MTMQRNTTNSKNQRNPLKEQIIKELTNLLDPEFKWRQ